MLALLLAVAAGGEGLQLAGIYNKGIGELGVVQVALVNYVDGSTGAQVGLVNAPRGCGPIGT